MKKKIIALVASLALVASVGAGATLAYLTDTTDTVTNTFTVGKVDIELTETASVDGTAAQLVKAGNGYAFSHVQPGDSYAKNPVVTVDKDSENCYVFVKVAPVANLTTNMVMASENEEGWVEVDSTNHIYRYSKVLTKNDAVNVFTNVSVATTITERTELASINVVACAVQSANLTAAEALEKANFGE